MNLNNRAVRQQLWKVGIHVQLTLVEVNSIAIFVSYGLQMLVLIHMPPPALKKSTFMCPCFLFLDVAVQEKKLKLENQAHSSSHNRG